MLLTTLLCSSFANAQRAASVLQSIAGARTELIAVLPTVGRQDLAVALKAAAARGTKVFLITEAASVHRGGYLLNVSHGPDSLRTYLYRGTLPEAWVLVDNAWVATGAGLDQEGASVLEVSQDAAVVQRLNAWARQVTQAGPISRPDLLKLHFGK
ncbi:hypothetical protein GCM10008957_30430 [Deinococcus ruber]|uniref:Phospholipase D-like domain-containing protein n=2 Tax=Deinococcus ruber TaxID=1848197 RepID=A0A918CCC4_9DEIO|nr:hypothetical protein GCM10008957_30430 [Deinococcus ruber]